MKSFVAGSCVASQKCSVSLHSVECLSFQREHSALDRDDEAAIHCWELDAMDLNALRIVAA